MVNMAPKSYGPSSEHGRLCGVLLDLNVYLTTGMSVVAIAQRVGGSIARILCADVECLVDQIDARPTLVQYHRPFCPWF